MISFNLPRPLGHLLSVSLLVLTALISAPAQASGITVIASFTGYGAGTNGSIPTDSVLIDGSGDLYGTASQGGPGSGGAIWEIVHGTSTIKDLVTFGNEGYDPSGPIGGVAMDASGNLYGTTYSGGANNVYGEVFELPVGASAISSLLTFDDTHGSSPNAGVTFDANGNMFGTTEYGGPEFAGTVWELPKGGTAKFPLANFLGTNQTGDTNGSTPTAGVTIDGSGNLFGTTSVGGSDASGTVWEIAHGSATLQTLAQFSDTTTGYEPDAPVTIDANGNLFGTAYKGGPSEAGTVWEIAHGTSTLQVVADFLGTGTSGDSKALMPVGGVTFDGAGNMFGTSTEGGSEDTGTVWEVAAGTHTVQVVASFLGTNTAGDPNGAFPYAGVAIDANGTIFGTTEEGGPNQAGTVWELAGVATPIGGNAMPVPTSLTLTPSNTTADSVIDGTITLSKTVAADTGITIQQNGKLIGTVTAASGSNTCTFTLGTTGDVAGTYTISASLNGTTVSQNLTLTTDPSKPVPSSIVFSPNPVAPNATTTATITLSAAAPAGGVNVEIYQNGVALGYVTVAAGSTTETFTDSFAAGTYTFAAVENGVSKSVTLTSQTTTQASLTSVSFDATSIVGGAKSTGTVTISGASSSSVTVTLSSSKSSALSVPSSVQIAAGQTSVTFTASSHDVNVKTTVTVTATYNGISQQTTITVNPPAIESVAFDQTSVAGGTTDTGTLVLTGTAPSDGSTVTLTSSNSTVLSVPSSVQIASGSSSITFTATTYSVTSSTNVTITATCNGVSKTTVVTVTGGSVALSSVTFSPTSVVGGAKSTGTVLLTNPAPSGGAVVTLSSSKTSAISVPSSVLIAAGQTSATFTASSHDVNVKTTVTVTATYSGVSQTATITVNSPAIASVMFDQSTIAGGTTDTGTLTLTGTAPSGGSTVTLTSSNTMALTVPSSVQLTSGNSTATFTATSYSVSSTTNVTVTATCNGVSNTAFVTVTAAAGSADISDISFDPTTVVGGAKSTGTILLSGPAPSGGAVVSLSSSQTSSVSVPTTVQVPAGMSSVTFSASSHSVNASTTVTITAVYKSISVTATIKVTPPAISLVSFNPATIKSGATSTGTLTLSGAAPSNGSTVTLTSSSSSLSVPTSVVIAKGSTSATFTATSTAVTAQTTVTVTAKCGGATSTATITLTP